MGQLQKPSNIAHALAGMATLCAFELGMADKLARGDELIGVNVAKAPKDPKPDKVQVKLGLKISDVILPGKDGKPVKLSELAKKEGKLVLIDLWSSTCGPCRKVLPETREFERAMRKQSFVSPQSGRELAKGVHVVTIADIHGNQYSVDMWRDMMSKAHIYFPNQNSTQLHVANNRDMQAYTKFMASFGKEARAYPYKIIVDPELRVVYSDDLNRYEHHIRDLPRSLKADGFMK